MYKIWIWKNNPWPSLHCTHTGWFPRRARLGSTSRHWVCWWWWCWWVCPSGGRRPRCTDAPFPMRKSWASGLSRFEIHNALLPVTSWIIFHFNVCMILICITPPMSHTPLTLQVPPVRALTVWVTQLSSSEGDLDEMVQRLQRELVDGSGDLFVQVFTN